MDESTESTTLSKEVFKDTRRKILDYLLSKPQDKLTIKKIKKETDVSKPTTINFINSLRDLGVVNKEKYGNQFLISVNTDSPYYSSLKNLLEIDTEPLKKQAEKIAKELKDSYPEIKSIYLFGSIAKGVPSLNSDIDLLIVTKKDYTQDFKEELQHQTQGITKKTKTIPSLTLYSEKQLKKDKKAGSTLIKNIEKHGELLEGEELL